VYSEAWWKGKFPNDNGLFEADRSIISTAIRKHSSSYTLYKLTISCVKTAAVPRERKANVLIKYERKTKFRRG